jgi:hypothetical protein
MADLTLRVLCVALVSVAVACGAPPSLTLVGPTGPISGIRLSECAKGLFSSACGDALPTTAPPTFRVSGAGGANLHVETNTPSAQMFVRIEQGTFENRKLVDSRTRQYGAAIHLDVSPDPYFVTISLDGASGGTSALYLIKVDASP